MVVALVVAMVVVGRLYLDASWSNLNATVRMRKRERQREPQQL